MSYQGRYATQAPSVSGISDSDDSDLPISCRIPEYRVEQPPKPRCIECSKPLNMYNPGPDCNACKDPALSTARRENSTGYKGVNQDGQKFMARVSINGQKKYLGMFSTAAEAYQAVLEAEAKRA